MIPVVVDPSFSLSVGSSFFFGRFDSMVPLASRRAGYFSLLAQREVTKRKSAPASAPIGLRPTGTLRCSPPSGRRTTRPSLASDSSPFPAGRLCSSALLQGARFKQEQGEGKARFGLGVQDARWPGPPMARRAGGEKARRVAGTDAGQFAASAGMRCQRTPGACTRSRRAGCPETAASGCVFSWLLLFGAHQREVTRAPRGERNH